jgi:hypothetical protein
MKTLSTIAAAAALLITATASQADTLTPFHTPSKNIYCLAVEGTDGASIDCEILTITKRTPLTPRPADCDLEWGNRFELAESGQGTLACTGDTVRDDTGMTLTYGNSFRVGSITCESSEKGLDCRNGEDHGFFLSKGRQELF